MERHPIDLLIDPLRKILAPLSSADSDTALFIIRSMLEKGVDLPYGVSGQPALPKRQLGYTLVEAKDFYTVTVINFANVSMRQLMLLLDHDSVREAFVKNDSRSVLENDNISIAVQIFRSTCECRKLREWKPAIIHRVNKNASGLAMPPDSKELARDIIEDVINIEEGMFEPVWNNKLSTDRKTFLLAATPIKQVPLSFFVYMVEKYGSNMLSNIVLTSAVFDGCSLMSLSVYCSCLPVHEDDSHASSRLDRRSDALHRVDRKNGIQHKKPPPSEGILRGIAAYMGFI